MQLVAENPTSALILQTVIRFKDLHLELLRQRLVDLSKSTIFLNTNLRTDLPKNAQWIETVTVPYSILQTPCQRVNVALLGLLSDEPGIFRDNTFRKIPISNVLETYTKYHSKIIPKLADFCIPLTHQSITRDRELAQHMLSLSKYDDDDDDDDGSSRGVIIGGHEHEPFDEFIQDEHATNGRGIRILKSGMNAEAAHLIDLSFDFENDRPTLANIDVDLVEMKAYEPSVVVQTIVDNHMSVVKALEHEYVIDDDTTGILPPGVPFSSERSRFQQTTVGAIFCLMIKEELEVDACIINGATIHGGKTYENFKMSYAELKKELPFPTKMVVVPMKRWELQEAIYYSRTAVEEGVDLDAKEIPRRGYLQVDWDFEEHGDTSGGPDDIFNVAVPRNLLTGFCNIKPLMEIGARLKAEGTFPGKDDFVPAIDLVVRHACKNKWFQILNNSTSFEQMDLNHDGVIDRHEVKQMMEKILGHEPEEFVVDNMIASIDQDGNGVIDMGEFSYLLATIEREHGWKKY